MKKSTVLIGLCAVLSIPAALADPAELAQMQHAIEARVDSGQFMGVVLVAHNGQLLFRRAYGLANVAQRIPNQAETRFRVGSMTKQVTAASILLLEQHGKLKLDDPIRHYMPEAPEDWSGITFRHLLTHTSGIPNLTSLPDLRATEGVSPTPGQLVERFRDRQLDFRPGTSFNYSNSGYILLGYLIEKISGEPYGRFVHEHFFRPLRMWSSGYEPGAGRTPHLAQGYVKGTDGLNAARYIDMSVPYSSAGLYSTGGDLLKWVNGLYGGKVLQPAELQQMLTPYKNHYGLGVLIESGADGGDVYSVGGGIDGFNTRVVYESRSKRALIVLSNVGGEAADELVADLRKVAEGQPVAPPAPPAPVAPSADRSPPVSMVADDRELDHLAGSYWTDEATVLSVTHRADHLQMQGAGKTRDLYPRSPRDFFARSDNVEVSFADDEHGRAPTLVIHLSDRTVHAERIGANDVQEIFDMRARKLQELTATPGSEGALRQLFAGIVAGTPDYGRLGPAAADLTRRELPRLQPLLEHLGSIEHIEFVGVAPITAADVYIVTFEHGPLQARIQLGPDGRIWAHDERQASASLHVAERRASQR
jgi:CubicO group peptidase (beta-lactamase class C family)